MQQMSDEERNAEIERIKNETIAYNKKLMEHTKKQDWENKSNMSSRMSFKADAFQLAGIVISQMYRPLDFNKKFRIVIEHDPDEDAGNVYFEYYN